jgi:hypothetical protein
MQAIMTDALYQTLLQVIIHAACPVLYPLQAYQGAAQTLLLQLVVSGHCLRARRRKIMSIGGSAEG